MAVKKIVSVGVVVFAFMVALIGCGSSKKALIDDQSADVTTSKELANVRTKASIMKVVMTNMKTLRYAYNRRLRKRPGLKGGITIAFAVDEFGKVVSCKVTGSSIEDPELEGNVTDIIKSWVFEKINKPGDVMEVTYPFVFSQ